MFSTAYAYLYISLYYGSYDNPHRAPLSIDLYWYFLVVWDLYKRFIQCFHSKSCPLVFWGMLLPGTINFYIFAQLLVV